MIEENYKLAGWAAIGSVLTFIPAIGLLVFSDSSFMLGKSSSPSEILPLVILLDGLSKVMGIYAFLQFRRLLNERYDFHAVDTLIIVLIFGGLVLGAGSYVMRYIDLSQYGLPMIMINGGLAFILGVIGIIFATRILKLSGNLNGLLKPFAYTNLVASVCFMTFILAPLALLLEIVCMILLALIFFGDQEMEELEII